MNKSLPVCGITYNEMRFPVCTPNGDTYEKNAIIQWINEKHTDPITREPLSIRDLVPNIALEQMYLQKYSIQNSYMKSSYMRPNLEMQVDYCKINNFQTRVLLQMISPDIEIDTLDENDIVVGIDCSGSMGTSADTNHNEPSGLSRMDMIKHALQTIISVLPENNRLGLVKYSSNANIVCNLTQMNETGKTEIQSKMDNLIPSGMTNIYDCFMKCFDLINMRTGIEKKRKASVFIFTDGEANIEPETGNYRALFEYKTEQRGFPCDVSIFTLGNNVDSELCDKMSKITGGSFGYMPDTSFIGDLLEHKLGNKLMTRANNTILKIKIPNNYTIKLEGEIEHTFHPWGVEIPIWEIMYGQNRNVVFTIVSTEPFEKQNPEFVYTIEYIDYNGEHKEIVKRVSNIDLSTPHSSNMDFHFIRQKSIQIISNSIDDNFLGINQIKTFLTEIETYHQNPQIQAIKEDFAGQISLAIQPAYFTKWGKHYLYSIRRAYQTEQCNNFKDKCPQLFGGETFKKLVLDADDKFIQIPAPKPSLYISASLRTTQNSVPNMASFQSRTQATCFHGSSSCHLFNGDFKLVKDICKNDEVLLGNGQKGIIECVLKCNTLDAELLQLNPKCHLTKYHPVKMPHNQWMFPCDLTTTASNLNCDAVYSFVLQKQNTDTTRGNGFGIIIGDIECATLGHGIISENTDNPVIAHDFFGTERVIDNLKLSPTYENGLVIIDDTSIQRNLFTNLVEQFNI
jgi:hypothetical protein